MNRSCLTCLWWKGVQGEKGECRAHAPDPRGDPSMFYARWPLTLAEDFCGEHQPPPVEQKRG
jgi:hypothetical protein